MCMRKKLSFACHADLRCDVELVNTCSVADERPPHHRNRTSAFKTRHETRQPRSAMHLSYIFGSVHLLTRSSYAYHSAHVMLPPGVSASIQHDETHPITNSVNSASTTVYAMPS
jgi:hypothetical protein